MVKSNKKTYTAVSLFAGAGGLDMGFERQGFSIIWANDYDSDACETHRLWSKAEVVTGDIAKIDFDTIPKSDIILGGFPCQGFSLAGPRRLDDSRNILYQYYVKLVEKNKPKMFIGENVKGILTLGNGEIIEAIKEDFARIGYIVTADLVNAADYGVPQDRQRVIIVGIRNDLNAAFVLPKPLKNKLCLEDVLKSFPPAKEEDICEAPYSSRYMSRNRKRNWNEPSFTIPAMAKQVPLHPSSPDMLKMGQDLFVFGEGKTRRLSYREAAAIQTFPPDMEFYGDLTSKYKQIGNAVPVNLAEVIAKEIYRLLKGGSKVKKAKQKENGIAFEYACLTALYQKLSESQPVTILPSSSYENAKQSFIRKDSQERNRYERAAAAAVDLLIPMEPMLSHSFGKEPLELAIQPDQKGRTGDVRDIVCSRHSTKGEVWEIGLSCKHNHEAVKHSRLSDKLDFGQEWMNHPCSDVYWNDIAAVMEKTRKLKEKNLNWRDIDNKAEEFYKPMLFAFQKELTRICSENPDATSRLVSYLLGNQDFYKIISQEKEQVTEIMPFNINGTLNRAHIDVKPSKRIKRIQLPREIYHFSRKTNSSTTLILTLDDGWTISFRLHNGDSKIRTSGFKFDVTLKAVPTSMMKHGKDW